MCWTQERWSRFNELLALYEFNWGKRLDFIDMNFSITQEELVKVLEIIVETGESVLVGFEKYVLKERQKYGMVGSFDRHLQEKV